MDRYVHYYYGHKYEHRVYTGWVNGHCHVAKHGWNNIQHKYEPKTTQSTWFLSYHLSTVTASLFLPRYILSHLARSSFALLHTGVYIHGIL